MDIKTRWKFKQDENYARVDPRDFEPTDVVDGRVGLRAYRVLRPLLAISVALLGGVLIIIPIICVSPPPSFLTSRVSYIDTLHTTLKLYIAL